MKVLFFIDRLRHGGIQALALNIVRHSRQSDLSIDVLTLDDGTIYPLEQTMKDEGCNVYKLQGIWFRKPTDFLRYRSAVNGFFAEHHNYDAVHMHSSSKNFYILKAAKKWNIPVRVAHSHNTGFQSTNPFSIMIGNTLKPLLKQYATVWCGCSTMACEWMFGKKAVAEGKTTIVHNGIDTDNFAYNDELRIEVRKEMGLEDKFVIGHIGRFERQKNHTFLIDIFAEVCKKKENAVLMLIGIGSLEEEMKKKVENYGIAEKVLFLGFRNDTHRLMQAMDAALFPSLYEGLSVVFIEAQAAGLPLLVSDSTTPETICTPFIRFKSLSDSAQAWAEDICNYNISAPEQRAKGKTLIKNSGFDIHTMIEELQSIYHS